MSTTHYYWGFPAAAGASQLLAPASPQAIATSATALSVTASSVANATGYKLYRSATSGGTYAQVGGLLTTPSFADTGLSAATAYFYKWQAIGNGSTFTDSLLSAVFSGTTATAAAPGSLAPTITSFSPASAAVDALVTLVGTQFKAVQGASGFVKFNGILAVIVSWSDTQIVARVPSGGASGLLFVNTADGNVSSATAFTVTATAASAANQLIYMDGQSNCTGVNNVDPATGGAKYTDWYNNFKTFAQANITPDPFRQFQRVFIWNATSAAFENLQAGVNNMAFGMGAEIGLAQDWEQRNAAGNLYIIKRGYSGQSIDTWVLNGVKQNNYTLSATAITNAKAWLNARTIATDFKAFYWHQGEADTGYSAAYYNSSFTALVNLLTSDGLINAGTMVIIAGITADSPIETAQANYVAAHVVRARRFSLLGLADVEVHFSARVQYLIGLTNLPDAIYDTARFYPLSLWSYAPAPVITSISPASGAVDATITIVGTGFTGTVGIKIGTVAGVFQVASDTSMTLTVPTGAVSGTLRILTKGGYATTPFTVTSVVPQDVVWTTVGGPTAAGNSVTGTGAGYAKATKGVLFSSGVRTVKWTYNAGDGTYKMGFSNNPGQYGNYFDVNYGWEIIAGMQCRAWGNGSGGDPGGPSMPMPFEAFAAGSEFMVRFSHLATDGNVVIDWLINGVVRWTRTVPTNAFPVTHVATPEATELNGTVRTAILSAPNIQ